MSYPSEVLQELMDNVTDDVIKRNPGVFATNNAALVHARILADNDKNKAKSAAKPSKYHNQRTHPEKDLEQFVHNTAKACGLLYYHTYRSRYSEPGFPDCIILGKWLLVVELKDTGKMPTPAQNLWLNVFRALKVDTRLWRPEDKDEIVETLARMRVI